MHAPHAPTYRAIQYLSRCASEIFGRRSVSGCVVLLGLIFFSLPGFSYAADLSFSPASGSFGVGQEFSVKVMVDPGTDSINASDGSVAYDKDLLSVSSFSKDGSVFSLWTAEPVFSNSEGTFSYSGGTPTAFSTKGMILTIKFKGKKAGSAQVSFSKGSVLAADGKGTDVYSKGGTASFTVTDKPAPDPKPAPTAVDPNTADATATDPAAADPSADGSGSDGGPPPIAPVIDSPTFPKVDAWYATSTGMFTWSPPPDVTGVRILLSDKDQQTPTKLLKPDATSTIVTGIKDGTSYFYVQYKNSSGWGDVATRKLQIDTVPPTAFDVALMDPSADGGVSKLSFKAADALSGVDHYEIIFGANTVANVLAKDLTDGTYPVPPQDGGPQTVTIKAYDLAGNTTAAKRDLTLPKVAKPVAKGAVAETAPVPASSGMMDRIIEILFALMIGGLASWNYYTRKTLVEDRLKILKRVAEVADKNDRIFSAMREQFEQMVNDFDKRPQLTPEERNFLEEIKEVLDVSEELIDTGIDDLKKMIRSQ